MKTTPSRRCFLFFRSVKYPTSFAVVSLLCLAMFPPTRLAETVSSNWLKDYKRNPWFYHGPTLFSFNQLNVIARSTFFIDHRSLNAENNKIECYKSNIDNMMCQWFDCCLSGLSAINNQQTLAYYLILPLPRDPVVGNVPSWAPGVSMWNILCLGTMPNVDPFNVEIGFRSMEFHIIYPPVN